MDRQTESLKVDSKGRITLGQEFANSMVIVERDDDKVTIRRGQVVPAREAWVHRVRGTSQALARALADARAGRAVKGPNLKAAARAAARIKD